MGYGLYTGGLASYYFKIFSNVSLKENNLTLIIFVMKKLFVVMAILCLSSVGLYSQCKEKLMMKRQSQLDGVGRDLDLTIEKSTHSMILFEKVRTYGYYNLIKASNGEYYFHHFTQRNFSRPYNVSENTPLIILLEDGSEIVLTPIKNYEGFPAILPVTASMIDANYKITKEQIIKLASSFQIMVRSYFLSENEMVNTYKDDIGTYYEDKPTNRNKKTLLSVANCILK